MYTANVSPPTINYVAPSRTQIGGLCYIHAPLQTFQTRYAIEMDQGSWFGPWSGWTRDDLDRSLHMTPVPFYECAGQFGNVFRFMDVAGLVDQCVDPYNNRSFVPGACGYYSQYRSITSFSASCHPRQQAENTVLTFRSMGWRSREWKNAEGVAAWVAEHGPVECGLLGTPTQVAHNLSFVGYDTRFGFPIICYQNSHGDNQGVVCMTEPELVSKWGPITHCTFPLGVDSPQAYNPVTMEPFNVWVAVADIDKNIDGVPDDQAPDGDGDRSLNEFDCGPNNPYQQIDTDGDGHCEPRLDRADILKTEEVCLAWCESLEQLATLTGSPEGGGQGCQDRCRDWDKCITTGVKNVDDTSWGVEQCTWSCLSTRGVCTPPADAEVSDCCLPDEQQMLDDVCRPLYHNVANVDGDLTNASPGTNDPYRIADVCEHATSTRPTISLNSHTWVTYETLPGGNIILPTGVCTDSQVKIEFGMFGGSNWAMSGALPVEITSIYPQHRNADIGVCGCFSGWASCALGTCPEGSERSSGILAWNSIDALLCADYPNYPLPSADPDLCEGKVWLFNRDEDCSDGHCAIFELNWDWGNHPTSLASLTLKTRVGVRDLTQVRDDNIVYTNEDPAITLPSAQVTCEPFSSSFPGSSARLDLWQLRLPHEAPDLPLGGRLGALAVGRDQVTKEIYVFELDKQLRGPQNPVRLTYASPTTPRVDQDGLVAVPGRVKSQLFGFAGTGTQALFVLGRREVPCPDCEDPSATTSRSELWVAGLDEGLRTLDLAEEVFGTSKERPPAMARPQAVYDRTMSRLVVAGGGEEGRFGVWAYTPHTGQWQQLSTPLPADLEGVAIVMDPRRHRLLLLGGRSGRGEPPRLVVVDLVTGKPAEVTPPPGALARSFHAMALDADGRLLYVFGGKRGTQVLGDLWQYDLRAREWTQLDDGTDPTGPGAREQAQMLYEQRYGRLWITGGQDDTGFKAPTIWGFSAAQNLWAERPLAPEPGPSGDSLSGLFSPGSPLYWELSIDEAVPYPGQLTRVGLTSGDPCVGLRVWDRAGERVAESRHCSAEARVATFLGQPGERYVVELVALAGFDRSLPTEYEVSVSEAELVSVGSHSVGPSWTRPRDLDIMATPAGPVAVVLNTLMLRSVDMRVPESPQGLDALALPRGVGTSLSLLSHGRVAVSVVGPGSADLQLVDVGDASQLSLADPIDLPGLAGRMAAVWRGGRVYTARAGKVEVVDLSDPAGPRHLGSVHVGGLITCLAVHGDRLYVCTVAKKLKVYELDRAQGETFVQQIKLDKIGQAVRVHGSTVHVGELPMWRYLLCKLGGSCNTGGQVEVLRPDSGGALGIAGTYTMGVDALPYLELTGDGALRITDGGLELYRVEALP